MQPREQETYEFLKSKLSVDLLNIDEELIRLPQYQMDASEYASDAAKEAAGADALLKVIIAETANTIRQANATAGGKLTEKQLEAEVMIHENVINAAMAAQEAEHDKQRWRNLVDSIRTKGSVLKTAAELITYGYIAPRAVVASGREAVNIKREEFRKGSQ